MDAQREPRFSRGWLLLVLVGWTVAVLAGFAILLNYQWRPGPGTDAPSVWPAASSLPLDPHRPTLVLFAHPLCPCTLATFEQLDRIAAHCRDRLRIAVFLVEPGEVALDPAGQGARERVARIPGVDVREDCGGSIAKCFHAETSGHAFLYSSDGRLLFQGGITGSRGHVGDNIGTSAVMAWVLEGASQTSRTPVFGCSLSQSPANERDLETARVPGSP